MELASMQENDEGQRAADLENDLQQLRERIEKKGGDAQLAVQKLLPLLQSLNALEKQESVLHSDYAESEAAISRLEHKLTAGCESQYPFDDLDYSLAEATEELNSAKKVYCFQYLLFTKIGFFSFLSFFVCLFGL
uniref:Coiled-coil domain-containing protein 93 n=1 Tax=Rhizophora mucronata TaxID=61149 RepID=A0A2P2KPX9_RHIMU